MNRLTIVLAVLILNALPVFAQQTPPAADERVNVAASFDVRNAYMLRGVRQDDTGTITSPAIEADVRLQAADRRLTSAQVRVGTWNSLHSGWAGSDGPSGKRWYESDVYTTLSLTFAKAVAIDTTYTHYRSPNDMFTSVNEVSVKAADRHSFVQPYALLAFELHTQPGVGQLDGGFKAGRYLELGAAPRHPIGRVAVAVPVRVGLSVGNYYELAGQDRRFGFASIGGMATLPLARWLNVHGGVEFEHLGEATKTFNGGDASKTIASVGIGFSR